MQPQPPPEPHPSSAQSAPPDSVSDAKKQEADALLKMLDAQIAQARAARQSGRRRTALHTARIGAILLLVILLLAAWLGLSTITELSNTIKEEPAAESAR